MRVGSIVCLCLGLLIAPLGAQGIGPGAAVPAVAGLPGLNGTYWQSDVVVQNPGETATSVVFLLFPEIRNGEQVFEPMTSGSFSIPAHGQLTKTNIVQSVFGLFNVKGALSVISTGATVIVGSRTYTFGSDGGSYGQEVFGILTKDRAWAPGLQNDGFYRSNIGIYVPPPLASGQTLSFEITLRDGGGSVIGTDTMEFSTGGMIQHSLSSFAGDTISSASVEVVCSDPGAVWYGYISRVDQTSGDAVFRPLRGQDLQ